MGDFIDKNLHFQIRDSDGSIIPFTIDTKGNPLNVIIGRGDSVFVSNGFTYNHTYGSDSLGETHGYQVQVPIACLTEITSEEYDLMLDFDPSTKLMTGFKHPVREKTVDWPVGLYGFDDPTPVEMPLRRLNGHGHIYLNAIPSVTELDQLVNLASYVAFVRFPQRWDGAKGKLFGNIDIQFEFPGYGAQMFRVQTRNNTFTNRDYVEILEKMIGNGKERAMAVAGNRSYYEVNSKSLSSLRDYLGEIKKS